VIDPLRPTELAAALVTAQLPPEAPEGHVLRAWLDTWSGVGQVLGAMTELEYHVRMNQSPFGWWAEFCRAEVNPAPRWIGRAHDAAPWRAVQRAALETLRREGETG
jgi:hypothetical protein